MPYRYSGIKKPSEQLDDLLSGKIAPENTPEAILSWARFYIYEGAQELISIRSREGRIRALQKIPPSIRPYIEREARKMWKEKKGKG